MPFNFDAICARLMGPSSVIFSLFAVSVDDMAAAEGSGCGCVVRVRRVRVPRLGRRVEP